MATDVWSSFGECTSGLRVPAPVGRETGGFVRRVFHVRRGLGGYMLEGCTESQLAAVSGVYRRIRRWALALKIG